MLLILPTRRRRRCSAQKLDEYAYFDKITDVAEAAAVKQTLGMQDILMEESQHKRVAKQMGIASRL
jgi:uncharacterized protein YerC